MNSVIQIHQANKNLLDDWWGRALQDKTVWPFLSFDQDASPFNVKDGHDWSQVFFMDASCSGVLHVDFQRSRANHDANLSIWVLDVPRKKMIAGRLLTHIPTIVKKYGISYLSAACHSSNHDSFNLMRRKMGNPAGRFAERGWNGLSGKFEDTISFWLKASEWETRKKGQEAK